jgi:DNA-binding NarL/FixJ family response regulator
MLKRVKRPRLLLVDDHPIFVQGLKSYLQHYSVFEIVGEARDGREAIYLSRRQRPDLILCDINLPDLNGFEVIRSIKSRQPSTKIIVMSMHEVKDYLVEAAKVGAAAYISKSVDPDIFISLLRKVALEKSSVDEKCAIQSGPGWQMLTPNLAQAAAGTDPDHLVAKFTSRELSILSCIGEGKTNKEISISLNLQDQTVKNYVSNILKKLRARDRTQAMVVAVRQGLIKPSNWA